MKVKCVKLTDPRTGEPVGSDSWLTVGAIYHVLEVFFGEKEAVDFRILGKNKTTPAYFEASQFEPVSSIIPIEWCVVFAPGSYCKLTPKAFAVDGFWEAYFDGEPEAVKTFQDVYAKIVSEEP